MRDTRCEMRDARSSGSMTGQFADQSDDYRYHPSAERNDRPHVISRQEIQSLEDGEMAVELRVGSQRYFETADELGRCTQRVPLSDVGWDRESGTTNLIDESEVLAQWRRKRQAGRRGGRALGRCPTHPVSRASSQWPSSPASPRTR